MLRQESETLTSGEQVSQKGWALTLQFQCTTQ